MLWRNLLDHKKSSKDKDSELVNVKLVAQLETNAMLDVDVNYSPTQLP